MSFGSVNTAHYHVDPTTGKEVEAGGLRDHCNVCRKKAGKKALTETELKLVQQAATMKAGSGAEPVEQLLADLQEQETANDAMRAQLKEKDAEIALLKGQLEQLKRKPRD